MATLVLLTKAGEKKVLQLAMLDAQVKEVCCIGLDDFGYPEYNWSNTSTYLKRCGYLDTPSNRSEYHRAMRALGYTGFETNN